MEDQKGDEAKRERKRVHLSVLEWNEAQETRWPLLFFCNLQWFQENLELAIQVKQLTSSCIDVECGGRVVSCAGLACIRKL